ncbi:MAG: FHA domain-containing protein [Anaerolineales bacterium]|nr:FHA domain-containing protein [Anaerolineales bacterium]
MLQVIDKTGWHKAFQLTKAISYIGSDPANDVVLESWRGAGVAHRHLQVISLPGGGYRLVNLSSTPIVLAGREPRTVPPHSFADVLANERFELGEFTLLLGGSDDEHTQSSQSVSSARSGPSAPGAARVASQGPSSVPALTASEQVSSSRIGVRLALSDVRLSPDRPIGGTVTVQNRGEGTGVQFRLQIEGLDPGCFDIGPGPILFPNAERDVPLTIRHPRGPQPPAGRQEIRIRVTAPEQYPGEQTVVSQGVEILPFWHHELRLIDEG